MHTKGLQKFGQMLITWPLYGVKLKKYRHNEQLIVKNVINNVFSYLKKDKKKHESDNT